jgi:hypothetical protein
MRQVIVGTVLVALLSVASHGCVALGVAAAAGGVGAEAGWWWGKRAAKTPPGEVPKKEERHDLSESR